VPVTLAGLLKRFTALLTAKSMRDGLVGLFVLQVAWADVQVFGDFMVGLAAGAIVVKVAECGLNYLLVLRLGDPRHPTRDQVVAVNIVKLVLLSGALAAFWLFTRAMGYSSSLRLTVLLVALGLGLGSLVDSLYLVLRMQGRQVSELTIKVGASAASVAVCSALVGLGGSRFASAVFVLESTLALAATAVFLRVGPGLRSLLQGVSAPKVAGLLGAAAPYGLLSVTAILYNKSNVFFLERLHGAPAVAEYSASWLIVDWVSVIVSAHLLAGVLFPLMSAWRHQDVGLLRDLTSRTWVWLLALAWPASLLLYALRGWLIGLFFPGAYSGAAALQVILVWTIPAAVSANVLLYAMLASGRQWPLLGFMLATWGVNLGLNLALVPSRGALGAALAITLSKVTLATLTLAYGVLALGIVGGRQIAMAGALGAALWTAYGLTQRVLPAEAAAVLVTLLYGAGLAWLQRSSLLGVAGAPPRALDEASAA
jgi:O-antigen/teichoic acid export membrane protein